LIRKLIATGLAVATAGLVASVAGAAGGGPGSQWFFRGACPTIDFVAAHCHAEVVTDAQGVPLASSGPTGYGPAQFHTAYNLPTSSQAATLQTIAIVDAYDAPTIRADLTAYDQAEGIPDLPTCTSPTQQAACFVKVNQGGSTSSLPRSDPGWALEISLDVEVAHAICQNCKIVLVEASNASFGNLGAAENQAAKLGANAISNSYGASESFLVRFYDSYYNHPGVAVVASSGDSGYGVGYPASSQYAVGVGGTSLHTNADGTRASESVWSGAGSGCSAYEPKPSWQNSAATKCSRKAVADVAADADPNTGAAVYDSTPYNGASGWFQVGGTSLASPLIAGTYALAGVYSPYPASLLWASPGSLFDVTTGSNGSCSTAVWCTAGPGWDGPSGLGTPNGTGGF